MTPLLTTYLIHATIVLTIPFCANFGHGFDNEIQLGHQTLADFIEKTNFLLYSFNHFISAYFLNLIFTIVAGNYLNSFCRYVRNLGRYLVAYN